LPSEEIQAESQTRPTKRQKEKNMNIDHYAKQMSNETQTESQDNATKQTRVTIMTNAARFELGQIVATPAALALLKECGFSAAMLIARHLRGDFGDICAEDAAENEFSVRNGCRIMSVYRLVPPETLKTTPAAKRIDLPTMWLITEADRSSTCLLLPAEY
jgi:hypothetical protein